MKIIYMGTPEFAVASLDAIFRAGFTIKGVVTSPDKPSGRGLQLHSSPVKEYAVEHQLPVLQPLKLKDPIFLEELQMLGADLQVIVAFRMLPIEVWSMPTLGTFNLHASLLPQYRGAAPINWAIINGETKTGVTTFFLNDEIDKGSVIYSRETTIGENETAGELHDRLMIIGAQLVVKTISDIAGGKAKTIEQHHMDISESLMPAPKIFKSDCRIQWTNHAFNIHNFVRGLSPYPAAWSNMILQDGVTLSMKIYNGRPETEKHELLPGNIVSDGKHYLKVAVLDGFYFIHQMQIQGRNQISVNEFLRGFSLERLLKFN